MKRLLKLTLAILVILAACYGFIHRKALRLFADIYVWTTAGRLVLALDRLAGKARKWYDKHSPVAIIPLVLTKPSNINGTSGMSIGQWNASPPVDEDDMIHTCGDCGRPLQHVRPGKWQCDRENCPPVDPANIPPELREGVEL